MLRKQRDVFEVQNLGQRRLHGGKRDLHDVETKRAGLFSQLCQIGSNGASQGPLLAFVDGMIALHERTGRARFHFDEHQRATIVADEIDLVASISWTAPVSNDDLKAALTLQ